MAEFKTLEEVEDYLTTYSNNQRLQSGPNKLNKTKRLMKLVENPQKKLRIIHVAGTSGKTSTASYLSKLLSLNNLSVGLTISPHLDILTERVQINNIPLPTKTFLKEFSIFLGIIKKSKDEYGYFEILFAFALYYFHKIKVDYVIVETGVGGLLDSTNVITNADKVVTITDIGLDHTNLLGNTISKIAYQKVGIMHHDNHLIMFKQSNIVMQVIESYSKQQGGYIHYAKYFRLNRKDKTLYSRLAYYQQKNWMLAYNVFNYLAKRDAFKIQNKEIISKSLKYQISGRMDLIELKNKKILLDGAHNNQKIRALLNSFKKLYPNQKAVFLVAFKKDKDFKKIINQMIPYASKIIITQFNFKWDYHILSVDPRTIQKFLIKRQFSNYSIQMDQKRAFQELLNDPNNLKIVTGSLYLISQIRALNNYAE
jgi:dihydrofolate synthase/folylpolyglutamate synthase